MLVMSLNGYSQTNTTNYNYPRLPFKPVMSYPTNVLALKLYVAVAQDNLPHMYLFIQGLQPGIAYDLLYTTNANGLRYSTNNLSLTPFNDKPWITSYLESRKLTNEVSFYWSELDGTVGFQKNQFFIPALKTNNYIRIVGFPP